jgi:purine-binding chemotaxis protein CheW
LVIDVTIDGRSLSLGLVADRVFEVTSFRSDAIEAAPDIGIRWRSDYIAGVVRRAGDFVVIVNLTKLFSGSDVGSLGSAANRSLEHA